MAASDLLPPYHDEVGFWPMVGDFPVYDTFLYELMTTDQVRNEVYLEALKRLCPGAVVLDVGTGADLVWARASVDAGAEHVFAIEAMEQSYKAAEQKIHADKLSDKITLLHGKGESIDVLARPGKGAEKVDLIVSEIIGEIASSEGSIPVLKEARNRFLKPEGIMVPNIARSQIAAATLPDSLHRDPQFTYRGQGYLERIFKVVGHAFDIRISIENFPEDCLLSDPVVFEDIDYHGPLDSESSRTHEVTVNRSGRLDGFIIWPEIQCRADGDWIDAMRQQTNWFPAFFPVAYPGVAVEEGTRIPIRCHRRMGEDKLLPDYELSGEINGKPFTYNSPVRSARLHEHELFKRLIPSSRDAF